jgi:SET domain
MFRISTKNSTHGQCLIALQDIPADTPIFDEAPAFMIPLPSLDNPVKVQEWMDSLTQEDRALILALYGRDPAEKLYMNGMPVLDVKSGPLGRCRDGNLGIYVQCARLNHSCRPNAARAVGDEAVTSVVAQRNIRKGDEITISYLDDNFLDAVSRTNTLRSKIKAGDSISYADGCQCTLCTASPLVISESDTRRKDLAKLRDSLLRGRLTTLEKTMEMIQLMTAEGMYIALMGVPATLKLMELLQRTGAIQSLPSISNDNATLASDKLLFLVFVPGVRVCLHKLRAKPELNGCTGVVVTALNAQGRAGVKLDNVSLRSDAIAIRPDNLCVMRK